MLTIRPEQIDAFKERALRDFERRTYAHVLEYFPRHCALLGEDQMIRTIRHGWSKAEKYELTAECCVRSYIDLMCVLGGRFDTDPLLPWAAEILNDKGSLDQVARGDRLHNRAWEYITQIIPDYRDRDGRPTTGRFVEEFRKVRALPDDLLTPESTPRFCGNLTQWIEEVFPAKYRCVGGPAVSRLITAAIERAARYGISDERGVTVVAALMFVLGRGFDDDPLIPWASAALNSAQVSAHGRGDTLYAEALHFLRRWWDLAPRHES